MAQLANDGHCICGNSDGVKFRHYIDTNSNELLGAFCEECKLEFLKEDFLVSEPGACLNLGRISLFASGRPDHSVDSSFMVQAEKTKIENVELFQEYLKPGDHIAWHRPIKGTKIMIYYHHAVVESTDSPSGQLSVIQWSGEGKSKSSCRIKQQLIDLKEQKGDLYRLDYSEDIVKANPPRLVLARARSRIGESGYGIFGDNCEFFAAFCIKGIETSQQVNWFFNPNNPIGIIIPLVIDGVICGIYIYCMYKERKAGDISRKEFYERVAKRVTSVILGRALVILDCMFPDFLDFPGIMVYLSVSSLIGESIGKMITSIIKRDDRAVQSIQGLWTGDHVVFYSYWCHPRHHAIVLGYNKNTNKVNIIHSTYTYGVIKEWVDFKHPVYRVEYDENECWPIETVSERAVSKLGKKHYNILWNNCKHFAVWCKAINP